MLAFLALLLLFVFGLSILLVIAQWKIYTKAGEPGWAVLIPIYNTLVLLRITGKPWWWLLLMLIPGVNIVIMIWMMNMLSKSFGKDEGFTVGLLLLGIIFFPILGFSRNIRYLGPYGNREEFEARRRNLGFEFENGNPA